MKDVMKSHLINYSMTFSPCQNYLAISNNFNSIKILNLNDGTESLIKCSSSTTASIYNIGNCGSLLVGTSDCYIYAWKWSDIEINMCSQCEELDSLFKAVLPINNEFVGCLQIISMYINEIDMIVHIGCSDGNIHLFRIIDNGSIELITTYKSNNEIVLCLTKGKGYSLISGHTDGTVRFWDGRQSKECLRIETDKSPEVRRPKLGSSINVIATDVESSDWILCGGQAQLSLWNVRAQRVGVVMKTDNKPTDDCWIPLSAILRDEVVIAGGNSDRVYLWDLSGQLNSEISLAATNHVFDVLHREKSDSDADNCNDFFTCGWGACVELYSDIGYRKKIFSL